METKPQGSVWGEYAFIWALCSGGKYNCTSYLTPILTSHFAGKGFPYKTYDQLKKYDDLQLLEKVKMSVPVS